MTDNSGNTTTSMLRAVCHANDSVILGTWLQETDHRTIEDQVSIFFYTVKKRENCLEIPLNISFVFPFLTLIDSCLRWNQTEEPIWNM